MSGKLLIDAHYQDETRIAIIDENGILENYEMENAKRRPIKGNIYLAKVVRIEPSIQAAFVDYGDEKHGFLPLSEIHYDYFNKNVMKAVANEQKTNAIDDVDDDKTTASVKKQMKIQEVLSSRQIILVQAEKEVRGNKCAFFTTFISIPGRYCVLLPNPPKGKTNGISKRIEFAEKSRLLEIMKSLEVPDGMNCIVRTAGENRTKQELKKDFEYLNRQWHEIREKVKVSEAPALIYEEGNLVKRSIRDLYQKELDKIIVQGKDAYRDAKAFMKTFTPSHVKKIELHDDTEVPIFQKYDVEEKINDILNPLVQLPSGGTIVINTTEALTAIDVNSGKSRNERNIEETALKTNLEAIPEIARQIKLRDIAGIIVIDFIDMMDKSANTKVEKKMIESMRNDHADIQFNRLSQFGLMEMSRQRLRRSIVETTFVPCKHCNGAGKILSPEAVALAVVRKVESFLTHNDVESILVEVAGGVELFILNSKRKLIAEMEESCNSTIEIVGNSEISQTDCKITVKEKRKKEDQDVTKTKNIKRKDEPEITEITQEETSIDDLIVNKNNIKRHMLKNMKQSSKNEKSAEPKILEESTRARKISPNMRNETPTDKQEASTHEDDASQSQMPPKQKKRTKVWQNNSKQESQNKASMQQKQPDSPMPENAAKKSEGKEKADKVNTSETSTEKVKASTRVVIDLRSKPTSAKSVSKNDKPAYSGPKNTSEGLIHPEDMPTKPKKSWWIKKMFAR